MKQADQWFERFPDVALRLQKALGSVVQSAFDGPARAMDLERAFELNRTFASRLNRAISAGTPREMATLLPGRPTMLRLVDRASELCRDEQAVNELREAYYAYLREVGRIASSQQELSAVLNAEDPQAQRESSFRQRAALFRAATDIVGGNIELASTIFLVRPNADEPRSGDMDRVQAYFGLRRMGAMDAVILASGASDNVESRLREPSTRLDGQAFDSSASGALAQELCSEFSPEMRTVSTGNVVYAACPGERLAPGVPVDLTMAVRHYCWVRNVLAGEAGAEEFIIRPNTPTKRRITDFVIHRDMWPGIEPVLKVYRDTDLPVSVNSSEGLSLLTEVEHYDELKRLSPRELLRPISDTPKHVQLVQYLFDHVEVNLDDFRAYRHMTRYPAIGQSAWIIFRRG